MVAGFEKNYSKITALLPRESAHDVIQQALAQWAGRATLIPSRGTLFKDGWKDRLFPSLSPEQVIVELVVPNKQADTVMHNLIVCGNLDKKNMGAIFVTPCQSVYFNQARETGEDLEKRSGRDYQMNSDLVVVNCILQKGKSDPILTAAMNEGAPGPTICYGEGHGVRDKLGIWRFTIDPQKEMIKVVVEKYALEAVFNAMSAAGRFNIPGMGFIYALPVKKGLINLDGVYGKASQLASKHQIIKAIDELKRGAHWRGGSAAAGKNGKSGGLNKSSDLLRLALTVDHEFTEMFVKGALDAGVPGLSVSYGRKFIEQPESDGHGIQLSKDLGIIEMVMAEDIQEKIVTQLVDLAESEKVDDYHLITQAVPYSMAS